jgi:hypothetical protein
MRPENAGRPPPREAGGDLPNEQLPGQLGTAENKAANGLLQAVGAVRRCDLNAEARIQAAVACRAHMSVFAKAAARHALLAAIQTETAPDQIADFFEWRLDDQLRRFNASFVDFWSFDAAFRGAAIRTMPRGPGARS